MFGYLPGPKDASSFQAALEEFVIQEEDLIYTEEISSEPRLPHCSDRTNEEKILEREIDTRSELRSPRK